MLAFSLSHGVCSGCWEEGESPHPQDTGVYLVAAEWSPTQGKSRHTLGQVAFFCVEKSWEASKPESHSCRVTYLTAGAGSPLGRPLAQQRLCLGAESWPFQPSSASSKFRGEKKRDPLVHGRETPHRTGESGGDSL